MSTSDRGPRSVAAVAAGAGIKALSLHFVYAAACAAVCVYLYGAVDGPIPPLVLVILLVGLWFCATRYPGSLVPLFLLGAALVVRLLGVSDLANSPIDATTLMLGALLPVTHQLAALAHGIPARGKFEWAALRPTLVRTGVTIAAVEILLLVFAVAA